MVWEWVWRFAARLSRHITAEYGLPRTNPKAQSSSLCWLAVMRRLPVLFEKSNATISRLVCVADADELIGHRIDIVRPDRCRAGHARIHLTCGAGYACLFANAGLIVHGDQTAGAGGRGAVGPWRRRYGKESNL